MTSQPRPSSESRTPNGREFSERLWVPPLWWLWPVLMAGSLWLVYQHAYGPRVSVPVGVGALVLGAAVLVGYGRARVEVRPDVFVAGRATLPLWAVGEVEPLEPAAARAARGSEADPRAYLLVRAYVPAAVRVTVDDPEDPVPYWYVSTRHPERLAAALTAARDRRG